MNEVAILFFSRDPGATNQLVAVHELLCLRRANDVPAIHALRKQNERVNNACLKPIIVAKKYALDVWRTVGVRAENWDEICVPMAEFLIDREVALVVTGADDIDEADTVLLWETAQKAGIPVVVFLDNLINLAERFRLRSGALIAPDLVFALDHNSVQSLAAAGIPENRILVTENLHHARLSRIADEGTARSQRLRVSWGADRVTQVILFASENTQEMAALGRPAPYDEHAVLQGLLKDIAEGQPVGVVDPTQGTVLVVIRPHPRDAIGKYDSYANLSNLRLKVCSVGSPQDAILAADLVAGMDSALLFEAKILGRPAVSLVPQSTFNEKFPS